MIDTDVRLAIRGEADQRTIDQMQRCLAAEPGAVGALCADNHLGYSMPIGGVAAYRDHISVSGVGYDIGCGNKATLTNLYVNEIDVPSVMDEIVKRVSFGMGRANDEPIDHPVLDEIARAEFEPQRKLLQKARAQLGTVGAGNHYVDLFADELERLWIGVHFGSRGFGHKTASGFLAMAAELERRKKGEGSPQRGTLEWFKEHSPDGEMHSPPVLLGADTEIGQSYIYAMSLAAEYAFAGRDVVVDKVLDILGAENLFEVHNNHNQAWVEEHSVNGHVEPFWVVRKGATPAAPGQLGFVGATMGEESVILEGIESAGGNELLYSTVHGAGRVMSRTQARGKQRYRWSCCNRDCDWIQPPRTHKPEDGNCPKCGHAKLTKRWVQESKGAIDWPNAKKHLGAIGVELRGGDADEAPGAYKRLDEVLAAHSDTIKILHRLRPVGVAMAGPDVEDNYKD